MPLGAPNKFEEAVTRIKGAKPDLVLITLVGADNVNFNRTFAGFGLDKEHPAPVARCSRRTRCSASAPRTARTSTRACRTTPTVRAEARQKFKAAYIAKYGDKAPQLATDRRRLLFRR